MSVPRRPEAILIALLALCPCATDGPAAAVDEATLARAAAEATKLQMAGRWAEARQVLRGTYDACGTLADGRDCRLLMNFSLGYLGQEESAADPKGRAALLREAERSYRAVLVERPDHVPTMMNLALVYEAMGDRALQAGALSRALDSDPDDPSSVALMLGDVYRAQGNWTGALAEYRRASESNPEAETPRRRIIECHEHLPPESLSGLMDILSAWEEDSPEICALGYQMILHRPAEGLTALQERAVLAWARLLASRDALTEDLVRHVTSGQPPDPLLALGSYLAAPWNPPVFSTWWMQHSERRDVLGQVSLAAGRRWSAIGNAGNAERCWRAGLQITPPYEEYLFGPLGGHRVVRLELHGELATLYASHPDFDADGTKLEKVISEVFEGKAAFYLSDMKDLTALQRFHTVLGLIYSQRKEWGTIENAHGALFQLRHAIDISIKREAREKGFYQPLPDLKEQLARGYRAVRPTIPARGVALEAAEAYLDSDAVDDASRMLEFAGVEEAGPDRSQDEALMTKLRELVTIRARVRLPFEGEPAGGAGAIAERRLPAWLTGESPTPLPPAFLKRQRFKILADRAIGAGGSAGLDDAAEAIGLAGGESISLVGMSDLIRIRKITAIISGGLSLQRQPRTQMLRPQAPGAAAGGLVLSLPFDARPATVRVSPDTFLAARIVNALPPRSPTASRLPEGLGLKINGTMVTLITKGRVVPEKARLSDRIKAVRGVTEVKTD